MSRAFPVDVAITLLRNGSIHLTRADYIGSRAVRVSMCLPEHVCEIEGVRIDDRDPITTELRCVDCSRWQRARKNERTQLLLPFLAHNTFESRER